VCHKETCPRSTCSHCSLPARLFKFYLTMAHPLFFVDVSAWKISTNPHQRLVFTTVDGHNICYRLCGAIYHGQNHWVRRWITRECQVWGKVARLKGAPWANLCRLVCAMAILEAPSRARQGQSLRYAHEELCRSDVQQNFLVCLQNIHSSRYILMSTVDLTLRADTLYLSLDRSIHGYRRFHTFKRWLFRQ
jgi:hypothetical protein